MATPPKRPDTRPSLDELRRKYPGMLPVEAAIFDAWWKDHAGDFTDAAFNVRVGNGEDPGPRFLEAVRTAAVLNSQLRIDAVLRGPLGVFIVEVKERATALAIGQLVSYRALYADSFPTSPKAALVLLTTFISRDMKLVCDAEDIAVILQAVDLSQVRILPVP